MKLLLFALCAGFLLQACKPVKTAQGLPDCVEANIRELAKAEKQNPPAEVWKWESDGKVYYYFNAPCCDQYSRLVDAKCNLICAPDGGFTGKGDGNCPDLDNVTKTLVWKDPRD